jgi:triacylglycerol esterase/lipase EstA (alpha/beta hydrolase family)
MEPVFDGIDAYVPIISRAVAMLRRETGHDKIIILAHSMGGLAARAYIRDHGAAFIAKVITLGTPHHGTALARFGKGENSHQMRWIGSARDGHPSDWLANLARFENADTYKLFVSMYSHHDNIIAPQTSCRLIGARNIALSGIGHVALVFDTSVCDQVLEEVRRTKNT